MTFINHVLPHSMKTAELASFAVAVQTYVPNRDFLREVGDEPRQVNEVVGIGNEKAVTTGHVLKVLFDGRVRLFRAEETGSDTDAISCGSNLLLESEGYLVFVFVRLRHFCGDSEGRNRRFESGCV